MVFEHDLLKSFAPKDALDSILIGEYQHLGPFSGKVFIDGGGLSAEESNRVRTEMLAAGFRSMADEPLTNTKLKSAGALLGGSWIKETGQSAAHVTRAVRDVSLFLSLPGMGDAAMKADPLGLLRSFSPSTSGASKVSIAQDAVARRGIQIWASPQPYNPESSARLWTLAQSFVGKAYFIGEDLFRLTNEGAVRRDVARASSISFVLNAVVFFMFIRNWYFLGVFLVGTAASWLAIFFALR
ncbi:MAG: hypothetical protein NTV34_11085, partial [Proteobacteria bacterium]|nr:hypothetical protein [Pseudomonadota bacterium]